MPPKDVKLIIYLIDQLGTDFVMAKNTAISSVAKSLKMHIQKNIHLIYKQEFYKDKQNEIYELFIEYLVPIMENIDHPELIKKWKQIIDAATYENNITQDVKILSIQKQIDRNDKTEYWPDRIK